jgi:hypothetical protein
MSERSEAMARALVAQLHAAGIDADGWICAVDLRVV